MTCRANRGVCSISRRKRFSLTAASLQSVAASAVPLRGRPSISAISPNTLPAVEVIDNSPADLDIDLAFDDREHAVARVALAENGLA